LPTTPNVNPIFRFHGLAKNSWPVHSRARCAFGSVSQASVANAPVDFYYGAEFLLRRANCCISA
jgi:hypothetical protein